MLTDFGKFCRKLRIDQGELLRDMAKKLQVTVAYLSAVEVGRRNVPSEWPERITQLYSLNKEQVDTMKTAIENSKLKVNFNLNEYSIDDRKLILSFAREFKDLDETTKEQIRFALQNRI